MIDRIDTVLAWADRALAKSREVLAQARKALAALRSEPDWRVAYDLPGVACFRCSRPNDGAICSACVVDMRSTREARA